MRDTSVILAARKRRGAYLNSLSDSDFKRAVTMLIEPGLSLARAWKELPPWGRGKFAGCRLSVQSVFTLRKRLLLMIAAMEAEADCRAQIPPPKPSGQSPAGLAFFEGIALAARSVIARAFQSLNSKDRLAAARLLLSRAEQRRWQAKMNSLNPRSSSDN